MATNVDDWIKVEAVASEMGLTVRQMWELMKAWGVPVSHPHNMDLATFRRSDFESCRDAGLKPPPPRKPRGRGVVAPAEAVPIQSRTAAVDAQAKRAKLKANARRG